MFNLKKKKKKGFTLIEMLVVIAVIAVLVSIVIPTVTGSTVKAAAAANAANLRAVQGQVTTLMLSGDGSNIINDQWYYGANGTISFDVATLSLTEEPVNVSSVDAPKSTPIDIDGFKIGEEDMDIMIHNNEVTAFYAGYTIEDFVSISETGNADNVSPSVSDSLTGTANDFKQSLESLGNTLSDKLGITQDQQNRVDAINKVLTGKAEEILGQISIGSSCLQCQFCQVTEVEAGTTCSCGHAAEAHINNLITSTEDVVGKVEEVIAGMEGDCSMCNSCTGYVDATYKLFTKTVHYCATCNNKSHVSGAHYSQNGKRDTLVNGSLSVIEGILGELGWTNNQAAE